MGPIDWILIEFSGPPTGAAAPYLLDLVDRGLIRIIDLVVVNKDADGTLTILDLADIDGDGELDLTVFEGVRSGVLGEEDVAEAAEAMEAGHLRGPAGLREHLGRAVRRRRPQGRRPARGLRPHPCPVHHRCARRARSGRRAEESTMMRRRGGLVRGVARTAVVAGTATAVSGRVGRRQNNKWSEQEQAQYEQQAAAAAGSGAAAGPGRADDDWPS